MGMRWRAVLVNADDDTVLKIALSAQSLIPYLKNQVDASVVSVRSSAVPANYIVLELFNLRDRPPECCQAPTVVAAAFPHEVFGSGYGFDVRDQLAKEPHVSLAILASRVCGDAMFVVCSDSLCCSGYLNFRDGAIVSGKIYGWNGEDDLWIFASNNFESKKIELSEEGDFNYYQPAAEGLVETIGHGADKIYLSPDGEGLEGDSLRYQIVIRRELITPIVAKTESHDVSAEVLARTAERLNKKLALKEKRSWWKFW